MALLLGAMAAAMAAQGDEPAGCDGALCYAEALAPFFARLEESRQDGSAPVHVIQIGDSHTAGDMITNGWRARLQARYGNGGRGVLAAGRPYAGYLTWGVTAWQTAGWTVDALFGGRREGGAVLGISGFTQSARDVGEALGLESDAPDRDFDRLTVCAIVQPGGGTILLRIGRLQEGWSLDAPERGPACRTIESEAPASTASVVVAEPGIVSIASLGTFRRGGVILSNLGVSGAQLAHFARSDDDLVRTELAAYRPDLIVLAFGTNEGFSPSLSADAYEASLRAQIARLRRLAGGRVPILLLGAPDAATRRPELADPASPCGAGWYAPRLLAEVRMRQRRVAREAGAAFWDWAAAMGGRCASARWRLNGDMRGDHVHFTRAGGERIGALIAADLERAAARRP